MKSPHELKSAVLLDTGSSITAPETVQSDPEKNDETVRLERLAFEGLQRVARVNPKVKPAEQMNYIFPNRSTH